MTTHGHGLSTLRLRFRSLEGEDRACVVEHTVAATVGDMVRHVAVLFGWREPDAVIDDVLGVQFGIDSPIAKLPFRHGQRLSFAEGTVNLPLAPVLHPSDVFRLVHEDGVQLGLAWPIRDAERLRLRLDPDRRTFTPAGEGVKSDIDLSVGTEPDTLDVDLRNQEISLEINGRREKESSSVVSNGASLRLQRNHSSWDLRVWLTSDHEPLRLGSGFVAYRARPSTIESQSLKDFNETLPAPNEPADLDWDWVDALLLPISMMLMYGVIVAVNGFNVFYLAVLLTPLASVAYRYRRAHRDHAKRIATYNDEIAAIDRAIGTLVKRVRDEVDAVDRRNPSYHSLLEAVTERLPLLWGRNPIDHASFLRLVVGEGEYESLSSLEVKGHLTDKRLAVWQDDVDNVRRLAGAPLEKDIKSIDLAIVGPDETVARYLSDLLMRICIMHSPADVSLAALLPVTPSAREHFEWMAWLPHCRVASPLFGGDRLVWGSQGCQDLVSRAADLASGSPSEGHSILVAHESSGVDVAELERLKRAIGHDLTLIWVGHLETRIPNLFQSWFHVQEDGFNGRVMLKEIPGQKSLEWTPEPIDSVREAAYAMSCLVDETQRLTSQSVSLQVPLGKLITMGEGPTHNPEKSLRAVLGETENGMFELDLVEQGPHVLAAGTTGSGKSELLRTMILTLAARYSPTDLAFILIDFKGGASLGDLAGMNEQVALPHVVGSVTNLTDQDVDRLIKFLRAEVARRQRKLAIFNGEYDRHYTAVPRPLPRLVVVIDEFAGFMEDQSAKRERAILEIAARGRSLGVHLVIATQSPKGVVTAQLTANVNARIALRTLSESDSVQVVGSGAAASIPRILKGRGFARLEGGEEIEFQSGYSGAHFLVNRRNEAVRTHSIHGGSLDADRAHASQGKDDATVVRENLSSLPSASESEQPRLQLSPLSGLERLMASANVCSDLGPAGTVRIGIRDVPEKQAQVGYDVPLGGGGLLLTGYSSSGRSHALRSAAESFKITHPDGSVVVVDAGGGDLVESLTWASLPIAGPTKGTLAHVLRQLEASYGTGCDPVLVLIDRIDAVQDFLDVERWARLIASGGRSKVYVVATSDVRLPLDPLLRRSFAQAADFIDGYPGVAQLHDGGNIVLFHEPSSEEVPTKSPAPLAIYPERRVYPGGVGTRPLGYGRREAGMDLTETSEDGVLLGVDRVRHEAVRLRIGQGMGVAGPARSGKTTALISICERQHLADARRRAMPILLPYDLGPLPPHLFDVRAWLQGTVPAEGASYANDLFGRQELLPCLAIDDIDQLRVTLSGAGMPVTSITTFLTALDVRVNARSLSLLATGPPDTFLVGLELGREVLSFRRQLLMLQPLQAHLLANVGGVNAHQTLRLVSNPDLVENGVGEGRLLRAGTSIETSVIPTEQALVCSRIAAEREGSLL